MAKTLVSFEENLNNKKTYTCAFCGKPVSLSGLEARMYGHFTDKGKWELLFFCNTEEALTHLNKLQILSFPSEEMMLGIENGK